MSHNLAPYADIEAALRNLLMARFPQLEEDGHVGSELIDVENNLPYCAVEKIAGGRRLLGDFPVVDVDFFHASRAAVKTFSELTDAWLIDGPHVTVVGDQLVVIDTVEVVTSPRRLPWEDVAVRRSGATYRFSLRRPTQTEMDAPEIPSPTAPARIIVGEGPPSDGVGKPGWLYVDSLTYQFYKLEA